MALITQEFQRKSEFHGIIGGVAGSAMGTPVPGGPAQVFLFFSGLRQMKQGGCHAMATEIARWWRECRSSSVGIWLVPFLVEGRNTIPEGMEI
ncbi:MAG TPA: hypothetical protein VNM47_15350 [Terriglobia bacterium]|nr:hypothetical protein [Terriglobia bacterium]